MCCVMLVGCATRNEPPSLTEHLDARQHDNWLFQPDYRDGHDAINELLAQQSPLPPPLPRSPDARLADSALALLGVRYRRGGSDPTTGFDCSGLVTYAARQSLGLQLPHRAADLAAQGKSVRRNQLQIGDLVFFNTLGRRFSHVGIYVGDNQFVHAPSSGGVVRVEDMGKSYWTKRYTGARRLDFARLTATSADRRDH